jgi:hypothetical protein
MRRLDRYELDGREIGIVMAKDKRKAPEEMRKIAVPAARDSRDRGGGGGAGRERERERSRDGGRERSRSRSAERTARLAGCLQFYSLLCSCTPTSILPFFFLSIALPKSGL